MADLKITGLTANTTPALTDVTVMVDDPGGTPLTQKITLDNIRRAWMLNGQIASAGTITRGTGFTCNKSATGVYDISFSTAFASTPIVVASLSVATGLQQTISVETPATTGVTVKTFNSTGAADIGFTFIVNAI